MSIEIGIGRSQILPWCSNPILIQVGICLEKAPTANCASLQLEVLYVYDYIKLSSTVQLVWWSVMKIISQTKEITTTTVARRMWIRSSWSMDQFRSLMPFIFSGIKGYKKAPPRGADGSRVIYAIHHTNQCSFMNNEQPAWCDGGGNTVHHSSPRVTVTSGNKSNAQKSMHTTFARFE